MILNSQKYSCKEVDFFSQDKFLYVHDFVDHDILGQVKK